MFFRSFIIAAFVVLVSFLAPRSASAEVRVEGTGEPASTSSQNNTQWVSWNAPSGVDEYKLEFRFFRDGTRVGTETYNSAPLSGTSWVNWSGVVPLPLEEGRSYEICVVGFYSFPNDSLFFPDGQDSCQFGDIAGKRTATTIDRSKPTVSTEVNGGVAATNDTLLQLDVDYEDALSAPFPANFLCVAPGIDAADACESEVYGYSASCSNPAAASKSTTFGCEVETSGSNPPDGKVFACVISADLSVPDNPTSANQMREAGDANLSDKVCDSVILDRVAPSATINTESGQVNVGESVLFAAEASDATSGLGSDPAKWTWNDGTPVSTGSSVFHTFTQTGTYTVQLEVADAAGNVTTATKVIAVADPDCEAARAKVATAKQRLASLKQSNAPRKKIKRAKARVERAQAAEADACATKKGAR